MRNLPLLLTLLLLSVLLATAAAQAAPVPVPDGTIPFVNEDESEPESEDEGPESEEEESDECVIEDEEDVQLCAEIAREERELAKAEQCVVEKAKASVTAKPGKRRLRLTVRYKTSKPAAVTVTASLRGGKGALLLGTDHARFRRSGVYRDTYTLAEKQVKKAIAAREFSIDLHAVNTPPSCRVHLTAHKGGARKLSWS